MKFLKDSFTTQFPSSDKSRVSAYPVAVITILFLGCFLYVLNPVRAIVTVIILLQIATGIMLSFNHERFGISNRKKAWGVVGAFALTYLISLYYEKVKRLTLSVIFFYCYLLNSASKGRGLPSVNIFTVLR